MKSFKKFAAVFAVLTALSGNAYAADMRSVAVGPTIGIQGIGLSARTQFADNFFGRIGFNYMSFGWKLKGGDLNYKARATFVTAPLMVDWHPIEDSGFRMSLGVAYNGNNITASATPSGTVFIDGVPFSPSEIGTLSAKLKLGNSISGLATIGYDNSFYHDSPLSFNCEFGVMYSGDPELSIDFSGNAMGMRRVSIELDAKEGFGDARKYLRFFPVLSLGLRYTF